MPWHVRAIPLFALLLACLPVAARADRVADLDSPEYTVRLAATEALLSDQSLTVEQVRDWLNSELSLEQRHRLLTVARHVVLRDLAAAQPDTDIPASVRLGFELQPTVIPDPDGRLAISGEGPPDAPITNRAAGLPRFDAAEVTIEVEMPNGQRQFFVRRAGDVALASAAAGMSHAVLVIRPLPGLPAYGRLRAGDLIVALNDRSVHAQLAGGNFADLLDTFQPGEPIDIEVLREGQRMHVSVPPCTIETLDFLYQGQPATLCTAGAQAWRQFLDSIEPRPSE